MDEGKQEHGNGGGAKLTRKQEKEEKAAMQQKWKEQAIRRTHKKEKNPAVKEFLILKS